MESNCLSSLEKEGSETGILGTGCGGTWFTWEPGRDPPDRRRSFMYWYIWEGDMPAGAYQNTNTIRDPEKWTDRLSPKDFFYFIIFVFFLFLRHSKRTSVWEAVGLKRWKTLVNKCVQLFTHMSTRGDSSYGHIIFIKEHLVLVKRMVKYIHCICFCMLICFACSCSCVCVYLMVCLLYESFIGMCT